MTLDAAAWMIAQAAAAIFMSWAEIGPEIEASHGHICVVAEMSATRHGDPVQDTDLICFDYPDAAPPGPEPANAVTDGHVCVFAGCAQPWPPAGGYQFAFSQSCYPAGELGPPLPSSPPGVVTVTSYGWAGTAWCEPRPQ